MAYSFGEDFLSQLRSRCDIVDVVGKYVELKRSSGSYVGLCPFHSEKTPSFHVSQTKQAFYCFGCNTGGDIIGFVMKIENLSFAEAVEKLAGMAGMTVPKRDFFNTELSTLRQKILEMNRTAARYFFDCLLSEKGEKGREYVLKRRLQSQTVRKFGIGYAPDEWDGLLKHLLEKGYDLNDIKASGLVTVGEKKCFDRFRNRLMFPIFDVRGNVIGFGGRALSEDQTAKYLNTSDTLAFKKGSNLYALNIAKNTKADYLIMCEGYMDVIALHQAGFDCAVASLGTALGDEQARLVRRYKENAFLCYDSDEAGKRAAKRGIDVLTPAGLRVKVIALSGGKDPDEILKQENGKDIFTRLLKGSSNSTEYKLDEIKRGYDLSIDSEKVECTKKLLEAVAALPSAVEREVYADKLATELSVSKDSIMTELKRIAYRNKRRRENDEKQQLLTGITDRNDRINPQRSKYLRAAKAEEDLISVMLNFPEKAEYIQSLIGEADFVTDFNRRVFNAVSEKLKSSPTATDITITEYFTADEMSHITLYISKLENLTVSDSVIEELVKTVKDERNKIFSSVTATDESVLSQLDKYRKKEGDK